MFCETVALFFGGGAGNRTRVRKHYIAASTCLSHLLGLQLQNRRQEGYSVTYLFKSYLKHKRNSLRPARCRRLIPARRLYRRDVTAYLSGESQFSVGVCDWLPFNVMAHGMQLRIHYPRRSLSPPISHFLIYYNNFPIFITYSFVYQLMGTHPI